VSIINRQALTLSQAQGPASFPVLVSALRFAQKFLIARLQSSTLANQTAKEQKTE